MAWRLHDLIHLHLTEIRLSDLETTQNPLGLCDDLLDPNERDLLFTFSPLKQEVYDVFNEIVRPKSKYITTLGQVVAFVNYCAKDRSNYAFSVLASEFSPEDLPKLNLADDLLVVIEFED
jgi:hypothetical protein